MKTESKNAKKLHEGRQFSYTLIEEYRARFLDPATGLYDEKYTTHRPCPTCGSNNSQQIMEKTGGLYHVCRDCSMVFTNPVFTDDALNFYYCNLSTGQADITANESPFYREIYTKGLNNIQRIVKTGDLLDVGCSSGFFLDVAKENGWETKGIEPGEAEAAIARNKGHELLSVNLDELIGQYKFDAISLWDVFEHIPDGHGYLQKLAALLNDDGAVFMQIPNAGALAARVMREKCNMFDAVEHCNMYNPKTIKKMVESEGFKIAYMESVISETSVLNNYLDFADPYFGKSCFGRDLLDCIDDDFIHKNYLGYKLQVVITR